MFDLVAQNITSTGTGDITLGTSLPSFTTMAASTTEDIGIHYSIQDGMDREIGYGLYAKNSNSIQRLKVFRTLVSGVLSTQGDPIDLTSSAIFSLTGSTTANTEHHTIWKSVDIVPVLNGTDYPEAVNIAGNIYGMGFPSDAISIMGFSKVVPFDLKQGECYIKLHWKGSTSSAGTVRWVVETAKSSGSTLGNLVTESTDVIYDGSSVVTTILTFSNLSTLLADNVVIGSVTRDYINPNDTYTGSAVLLGASLVYPSGAIGKPTPIAPFSW